MTRPTPSVRRRAALLALLLGACASDLSDLVEFDDSAGVAAVVVRGDGELELDGAPLPFDEAVQQLEARAAAMTAEQRACYVVTVRIVPVDAGEEASVRVRREVDLLLDRLSAMDLKHVELKAR